VVLLGESIAGGPFLHVSVDNGLFTVEGVAGGRASFAG
jgi:hypothetical protein